MTRLEFDKLSKDKTYDDIIYGLLEAIDTLQLENKLNIKVLDSLVNRVIQLERYADSVSAYFTGIK